MHVEQSTRATAWDGTVPSAIDWRVVALVVALSGVAASLNLPYGGPTFAAVAFVLLAGVGTVAHVLGERRLRRITTALVDRWSADGARIEGVSRTSGAETVWTVHTANGPVTVRGLALAPVSRLAIERDGIGDTVEASAAEARLDALADEWYREVFATA